MIILGIIFIFFILGRVFPYLGNSIPLGYDPGLYFYLFKYAGAKPDWLMEGYPPGLPVLGKLLSIFILPEKLLIPLIIFFSALLFFSVYLLGKKLWGKKTALWTVLIFACSALQYRVYWYYYLKNIAAMSFMLFTIYYLLFTSYLAIPFAILTVYFHRPTFAILLVALVAGFIFEKKKRKFYGVIIAITAIVAFPYYFSVFDKIIQPLIQPVLKSFVPQGLGGTMGMPSGTFYNRLQALALSLIYLPFAIYGFKKAGLKKNLLITAPLLAAFLIVVSRFFLCQRFTPFLDLFLIFFAGYGVSRLRGILAGIYIGLLVLFVTLFIYKTAKPLICEDELNEIRMLSETEPDSYVLVTDQAYMPWVYGWSNRKPIAPGFGEYDIFWTIPEWHEFWESDDRQIEHDLLLKLPKPLYIYHGDKGAQITTDFSLECFEKINWRTYRFVCEE